MRNIFPTIVVEFDETLIPKWARRYPEVVELARRNLAYRCDVFSAQYDYYRRHLIRVAQRWARAKEEQ